MGRALEGLIVFMKITLKLLVLPIICAALGAISGQAAPLPQVGSAFTYQGRLSQNGAVANGSYDLQFVLRDAAIAGAQVGGTIVLVPVIVSNGLFTVPLDFGSAAFDGNPRWLEIGVRTNGSLAAYEPLTPAQPVTATPYALLASTARTYTGRITDTQLSGNIPRLNSNATFTGAVQFSNAADSFT